MPLDEGKLLGWATSLCRPLVQHLTFENSEAITEEGKPLVVLFVKADDQYSQVCNFGARANVYCCL
jgi:hypothetical protein